MYAAYATVVGTSSYTNPTYISSVKSQKVQVKKCMGCEGLAFVPEGCGNVLRLWEPTTVGERPAAFLGLFSSSSSSRPSSSSLTTPQNSVRLSLHIASHQGRRVTRHSCQQLPVTGERIAHRRVCSAERATSGPKSSQGGSRGARKLAHWLVGAWRIRRAERPAPGARPVVRAGAVHLFLRTAARDLQTRLRGRPWACARPPLVVVTAMSRPRCRLACWLI